MPGRNGPSNAVRPRMMIWPAIPWKFWSIRRNCADKHASLGDKTRLRSTVGERGKLRGGRRGTQPERTGPPPSRRRKPAALAANTNAARDERADLRRERAWSLGIRATCSP
jgi:hypothetical protein